MEVNVRNTYTECKGTRIVQNPVWAEFWAQPNAQQLTNEQTEAWFRERGAMRLHKGLYGDRIELFPDEEQTCYNCEGTGYNEKWLDLAEFLALCPGAPR